MIADVHPIARLPRRIRLFSYAVPPGLALAPGDLVLIPLRARKVAGVVSAVREGEEERLKAVLERLPYPPLSEDDLARTEALAFDLAQSPASILNAGIPPFPRRPRPSVPARARAPLTIPKTDASAVAEIAAFLAPRERAFASAPDARLALAAASAIGARLKEPKLLILPTVRAAELAHARLGGELLTGKEPSGRRFSAWNRWRTEGGWLVGTHTAALLPRARAACFALDAGHEAMRRAERNPRFSVRQAFLEGAGRAYFLDVSPRLEDLARLGAENVRFPAPDENVPARFVDRMLEAPHGPHPSITATLDQALEHTLAEGKRALLVLNRKGVFHAWVCTECRAKTDTSDPIDACPSCGSLRLKASGFGIEAVKRTLLERFPGRSVATYDRESAEAPRADVLVATRAYLESSLDPYAPEAFGLVALLDTDAALLDTSERATEDTLRTLLLWRGVARASGAAFLVQTRRVPFLERLLSAPEDVLREDARAAEAYRLPPYARRFRATAKGADLAALALAATEAGFPPVETAEDALTWLAPSKEESSAFLRFFANQDDRYIIDTNA